MNAARPTLGDLLAQALARGLTYTHIAETCGVSRQIVRDWARDYPAPEPDKIDCLAEALSLPAWQVAMARLETLLQREGRRHSDEVAQLERELEALERQHGPFPDELGSRPATP